MPVNRQLLFNHIPKTGGVTLRIILNRVYGEENLFLIQSTDIGASLKLFSSLSREETAHFAVVVGHGAELFLPFLDDPFRITILREPVALFLSQYYYLNNTENAGFYEEVNRLDNIEEYLAFAIENGQDNLMTRYLSGSVRFLADPALTIPSMLKEGDYLLQAAINSLNEYDAIIDLDCFDAGIFTMAGKLGWKKIPLYRPANRNRKNPGHSALSKGFHERLKEALKWDIALYGEFKKSGLAAGNATTNGTLKYKLLQFRQKLIGILTNILNQ
jgi:hypothetical protein